MNYENWKKLINEGGEGYNPYKDRIEGIEETETNKDHFGGDWYQKTLKAQDEYLAKEKQDRILMEKNYNKL
ncbi:MAG: hypothetical protein KKH70_20400 [Gammaproteobacteria bacterium]|nr:hypothetical protein [Gammaproteobacteria bacterium]